jgi:hypothetical protein
VYRDPRKGLEGRGRKTALRFCFWSLRLAQTPCLYPVWSFAYGKTPEVNPRSGFTTGTPDTPEFFAKQKMRPNQVLKKPSPSVDFLQVEAL